MVYTGVLHLVGCLLDLPARETVDAFCTPPLFATPVLPVVLIFVRRLFRDTQRSRKAPSTNSLIESAVRIFV
jgi:hypothetical protein